MLGADGGGANSIYAKHEDHKLYMQGHDTFREAVRRLSGATLEAVAIAGMDLDDIDLFVYHQANTRILSAVGERLSLDTDKVIDCIDRYGNTSSATIPIALAEARETGKLKTGDKVLLGAFGAGFTWGAGVIEWRMNGHEGCALVTGASRGIGAAIARGSGRGRLAGGRELPQRPRGRRASGRPRSRRPAARRSRVQADVVGPEAADGLFKKLEEELGPVLVLVNNAGMRADGLSPQIDDDDWDRVLDTNLSGAFRTTRRALGPMLKARYGRIVNIASIVGQRANPGQANYAASKAGLVGMTKTVAAEVARRKITVNAVAPGLVETEMTEDIGDEPAEGRPRPPRRHARGGRRMRAVPGLRRSRVRDRIHPDSRRRSDRLTPKATKERHK